MSNFFRGNPPSKSEELLRYIDEFSTRVEEAFLDADIEVEDEGTSLTTAVKRLNIVGSGIVATEVDGVVTLTVGGDGSTLWGDITGTLADQTDLDTALDTKLEDITGESIKDLSDVFTTMTPTDGQALIYDTTNGWQAETLPAGGTIGGSITDNQVAVGNGTDAIDGSANLTFAVATLTVGSASGSNATLSLADATGGVTDILNNDSGSAHIFRVDIDPTNIASASEYQIHIDGTEAVSVAASGAATFAGDGLFLGGTLGVGLVDGTKGILELFGSGTPSDLGGEARIYLAADWDSTHDYWSLEANQADLRLQLNTASFTHVFDVSGSVTFDGSLSADSLNASPGSDSLFLANLIGAGTHRMQLGVSGPASYITAANTAAAGSSLILRTDDASGIAQNALTIDASQDATFAGDIHLLDSQYAYFGTGDDLFIRHTGTGADIINGVGDLLIQCGSGDITLNANGGSGILQGSTDVRVRPTGLDGTGYLTSNDSAGISHDCITWGNGSGDEPSVELFYDGASRLKTTSAGADFNGQTLQFGSNGSINDFGGGGFQIYGDSSIFQIIHRVNDGTMNLVAYDTAGAQHTCMSLGNGSGDEPSLYAYYDAVAVMKTISNGIQIGGSTDWRLYFGGIANTIQASAGSPMTIDASSGVVISDGGVDQVSFINSEMTLNAASTNVRPVFLMTGGGYTPTWDFRGTGTLGFRFQDDGVDLGFIRGITDGMEMTSEDATVAFRAQDSGASILGELTLNEAPFAPARRNLITNGNFQIWQQGTSFVSPGGNAVYVDGNWRYENGGTGQIATHTLARSTDVPTIAECGIDAAYSFQVTCTTADTSTAATQFSNIHTRIEAPVMAQVGENDLTLSFWHKHTKTGTHSIALHDANSSPAFVDEYTQTTTNTWEKAEITIPYSASAVWGNAPGARGAMLFFALEHGSNYDGTAGTWEFAYDLQTAAQVNNNDAINNIFKIALVQLEVGTKATQFEKLEFQEELALCQRYFEKSTDHDVVVSTTSNNGQEYGIGVATSAIRHQIKYKVNKATVPTVTAYNPYNSGTSGQWYDATAASNKGATVYFSGEGGCLIGISTSSANNQYGGHWSARSDIP